MSWHHHGCSWFLDYVYVYIWVQFARMRRQLSMMLVSCQTSSGNGHIDHKMPRRILLGHKISNAWTRGPISINVSGRNAVFMGHNIGWLTTRKYWLVSLILQMPILYVLRINQRCACRWHSTGRCIWYLTCTYCNMYTMVYLFTWQVRKEQE